jgi:hypothetical protein
MEQLAVPDALGWGISSDGTVALYSVARKR